MKTNRMKRMAAFVLAGSLLLSGMIGGKEADIAFAEGETPPVETTVSQDAAATTTVEKQLPSGIGIALMEGEAVDIDVEVGTTNVIPITMEQKGYLNLIRTDESEEQVKIAVVSTDRSESYVDEMVDADDETGACALTAGDYLVAISGDAAVTITLKAQYSAGVTLSIGRTNKLALMKHDSSSRFYAQFQAQKTGYLEVENKTRSKVSIGLTDLNKKSLSPAASLSGYSSKNHKDGKTKTGYGVIKGKTYLLYVKAASSVKTVSLATTIKNYNSIGGRSFKGAKTLKRGKKVYATLGAGEKASYFQFKKSSYGSRSITIKSLKNQGKLTMRLYYKEVSGKKKGKILPVKVGGSHKGFTNKAEYQSTFKIPANWPNRTYYIKVYNSSKTASGSYQMTLR